MYTVTWSDQTDEFETRQMAIDAAKDLSDGRRNPVEIQDDSQREVMVYRDGILAQYTFETRPGRASRG